MLLPLRVTRCNSRDFVSCDATKTGQQASSTPAELTCRWLQLSFVFLIFYTLAFVIILLMLSCPSMVLDLSLVLFAYLNLPNFDEIVVTAPSLPHRMD